ncbi:MAG: histone deacetylase family protein [Spirulinaceae cyanobacterium]
MVTVIYSDRFLDHKTGSWHPESPARLEAIVAALKQVSWASQLQWQDPTPLAGRDPLPWIAQCHSQDYIERLEQLASQPGGVMLDPDTAVSDYEVVLLAVNAWLDGVDQVVDSNRYAFVAARPPGHHAERDRGMGFCLLSNAAIAAHYALSLPQIQRVGILDWDVHHGNGTQHIVETNGAIAYCSLHQSPCYPGTGQASEQGNFNNVCNIPLFPGCVFADYEAPFEQQVLPFFQNFKPDLLIVSAGYDANHADQLAAMHLKPEDYGRFTEMILALDVPILFGLEGGYDLEALGQSVVATIGTCLGAIKNGTNH